MTTACVSYDTPLGTDGALGDLIADDDSEPAHELAWRTQRDEQLRRVLALLPERERTVLELRFGLAHSQCLTLEQVGRTLGVTRERVRQIEAHALTKLADLPAARALCDNEREAPAPA
jgi:RNA polymerase primary sigma factor